MILYIEHCRTVFIHSINIGALFRAEREYSQAHKALRLDSAAISGIILRRISSFLLTVIKQPDIFA